MSRIVQEAVEAGALGFSSSRTLAHRAMDGEPVPGTFAAEDELFALGRALAAGGGAVFELAPQGAAGEDIVAPEEGTGVDAPARRGDRLRAELRADPGRRRPEPVARTTRPLGGRPPGGQPAVPAGRRPPVRHAARLPRPPRLHPPAHLPPAEGRVQPRGTRRPAGRTRRQAAILAEDDLPIDPTMLFDGMFAFAQYAIDRLFVLGEPPDYEPTDERTVAAIARERGEDPLTTMYDLMLESDAGNMLMLPLFNYADAQPRRHPRDDDPSGRRAGPVRRRRALQHDLRRVLPDLPADALGARPPPRREAAAGVRGAQAVPRHRAAVRTDRPRRDRGGQEGRPQRHRHGSR